MSIAIGGGFSPYTSYSYTPPHPSDLQDVADAGVDFGMDDIAPVDFSPVMPVSSKEQITAINPAENSGGRDSFRREHSTAQQDLREIQSAMIGFATKRALELQNITNT